MSGTGTGSFNVGSSTLYRYPIIAALSIVLVIGGMLCWRSRVIERRARLLRPPITVAVRAPGSGEMLLVDIAKAKPRFYDVYLQLAKMEGERERVWCEIMPLSQIQSPSVVSGAKADGALDPLVSALSTVALMIAMPSPKLKAPPDPEQGNGLPHLEFAVADVEVLKAPSTPNLTPGPAN